MPMCMLEQRSIYCCASGGAATGSYFVPESHMSSRVRTEGCRFCTLAEGCKHQRGNRLRVPRHSLAWREATMALKPTFSIRLKKGVEPQEDEVFASSSIFNSVFDRAGLHC